MYLSAWHSYRLYEQEMLIFSIKKIGSLLYVGSLERVEIKLGNHKIIKMLKLLLQ